MSAPVNDNAPPRGLRIGINAQLLSHGPGYRRAGIHHYISQVIGHLPQLGSEGRYIIYTGAQSAPSEFERPGMHLIQSRLNTERRFVRILWEQTVWPVSAMRERLDLIHSMAFVTPLVNRVPELLTIYDLSFFRFPDAFPSAQRRYLQSQTARSARNARRVITISEASRRDIHALFHVPMSNVDVIPPGVDARYMPYPTEQVRAFRKRNDLPAQFLLHVGTLQPRKNIPAVLEAMAVLQRPEVELVLIGGKGWMYDEIYALVASLGLREQVHFAGYVADEELPLWYNAASALVFPSSYEGFGLPVVEAMACGLPVIAAASSSIPEAGGDAAIYVDPQDSEAFSQAIGNVLDDQKLASMLSERGIEQARHFTWDRAGALTAAVYHKAVGA